MTLSQLVARNVRARRKKLGLSQQVLSNRCRLTVRYISRLENTAPNITLEVFERLAEALDCAPHDILHAEKTLSHVRKDIEQLEGAIELLQKLKLSLGINGMKVIIT